MRGVSFNRYRRPIVLGGIIAMLSLTYIYRLELIGDLSKEKELLVQHTDIEGSNKIKDTIRETQLDYFKSLSRDKK